MESLSVDGWAAKSLLGLLIALLVTLLVFWLAPLHPLLEVATNVRAQVMPLALIPLVGFAVQQRWTLTAAAFVVVAINAAYLVPYWTASADPLPLNGETVTVMQYNIYFGNDDYEAMAAHVMESDADVVALHELLPEQWDELGERLEGEYPHRIGAPLDPLDGQPGGGMALLSRTALTRVEVDESMSPPERVTLVATTLIDGAEITVVGLHPYASRTDGAKVRLRRAQLSGVVDLAQTVQGPMIILTDLNLAPTSPVYQNFLSDLEWRDPHRIVGWQSSWPSWGGPFGLPIDHVLVSDEFGLHRYDIGDGAGSDHKSVIAEVSLP